MTAPPCFKKGRFPFPALPVAAIFLRMWQLKARGARGTPFEEIGAYPTIADAARQILKLEGGSDFALSFRVHVDTFGTLTNGDTSDAEFLSRLEYQSPARFFLLTRRMN